MNLISFQIYQSYWVSGFFWPLIKIPWSHEKPTFFRCFLWQIYLFRWAAKTCVFPMGIMGANIHIQRTLERLHPSWIDFYMFIWLGVAPLPCKWRFSSGCPTKRVILYVHKIKIYINIIYTCVCISHICRNCWGHQVETFGTADLVVLFRGGKGFPHPRKMSSNYPWIRVSQNLEPCSSAAQRFEEMIQTKKKRIQYKLCDLLIPKTCISKLMLILRPVFGTSGAAISFFPRAWTVAETVAASGMFSPEVCCIRRSSCFNSWTSKRRLFSDEDMARWHFQILVHLLPQMYTKPVLRLRFPLLLFYLADLGFITTCSWCHFIWFQSSVLVNQCMWPFSNAWNPPYKRLHWKISTPPSALSWHHPAHPSGVQSSPRLDQLLPMGLLTSKFLFCLQWFSFHKM